MPILCYKNKVKINNHEETLSFAFNCVYDDNYHLKLKEYTPDYFDSGDFRIKIDEAINNLNYDLLSKYEAKNNGVRFMALLDYFYENIPGLYSIKFESDHGDSIYYVNELKK